MAKLQKVHSGSDLSAHVRKKSITRSFCKLNARTSCSRSITDTQAIKMFSAFKLGSHISTISDKIKSIGLPVTSGTVVLTTSLLNYLLSHSVFKCPTQTHAEYGWYFLLLPGVLLAVITLLASVRLSQAFTGFCRKDIDVPKSAMGGKRKRTWKYIIRKISIALVLAILSFMSWVIISLLSTETYACIKIGPVYKRNNSDLGYKMRVEKANIDSKKYGLVLLLFSMLITFMVNVIVKCCFTDLPDKDLPSMRRLLCIIVPFQTQFF